MRRVAASLAGLGAVAAAVLGTAGAASASTTTPAVTTSPVLYQAFGTWVQPVVKPGDFGLGADFILIHLKWSAWASSGATGSGTDKWSNGARGYVHHWPTTVTLWGAGTHSHNGVRYYSGMKLVSPGHRTIRLTYRTGGWYQS